MGGQRGEEELVGGRVGRFNRRFEGMGGSKTGASGSVDWMDMGDVEEGTQDPKTPAKDTKGGK
jgi:hypothetical protein